MWLSSARSRVAALIVASAIASLASGETDTLDPAALSAGTFTTSESGPNAYAIPVAMLDKERAEAFIKGKEQFNEAWVFAPEPGGVWGLGPTFNEDRCAHCHQNNGRARAPEQAHEAEDVIGEHVRAYPAAGSSVAARMLSASLPRTFSMSS